MLMMKLISYFSVQKFHLLFVRGHADIPSCQCGLCFISNSLFSSFPAAFGSLSLLAVTPVEFINPVDLNRPGVVGAVVGCGWRGLFLSVLGQGGLFPSSSFSPPTRTGHAALAVFTRRSLARKTQKLWLWLWVLAKPSFRSMLVMAAWCGREAGC